MSSAASGSHDGASSGSTHRLRLGVLASGRGSNLQALIDAASAPSYPAEVALVLSDVESSGALEKARAAGIPNAAVLPTSFPSRVEHEAALSARLEAAGVELVCLAGYMRLLGKELVRRFSGRLINIHPSLLPAFPGLRAIDKALEHGVKVTGCTLHLVDEGVDSGPILAQAAVPVRDDDDTSTLAERIHREEHRLYPEVVAALARGHLQLEGRRARIAAMR